MTSRALPLALVGLLACTPSPPSASGDGPPKTPSTPNAETPTEDSDPPSPEPTPLPAADPPGTLTTAVKLPESIQPWVWRHAMPTAVLRRNPFFGVGPVSYFLDDTPPRRYTAELDGTDVFLSRDDLVDDEREDVAARAWTLQIPGTALDEPVVMSTKFRVFVAFRTEGGYRIASASSTGTTIRGDARPHPLEIKDPRPSDGPYALQLMAMGDGSVDVHARGRRSAYLDEIDLVSRAHRARAHFDDTVLTEDFEWPPEAVAGQRFGHRFVTPTSSYVVERKGSDVFIKRLDDAGAKVWRSRLIQGSGRSWTSSAVLEHDRWVVAVTYNHRSTGNTSDAIDKETGKVMWLGPAGALGTLRRTGHRNEVAALIDAEGHLVVYGREKDGDYRGVLNFIQYSSVSRAGVGYELRRH